MKKHALLPYLLLLSSAVAAQTPSNAQYQIPFRKADAQVFFDFNGKGIATPIEWGFDLAWLSEDNVRRGIAFCGKDVVDMMRVSYRPTAEIVNNKLDNDMLSYINKRASIVKKYCKEGVGININDDHDGVSSWYNPTQSNTRAQRWTQVIDLTAQEYVKKGLNLVSISPFNEPDYGWDQGLNSSTRKQDFLNICKELRKNEAYDNVRLCGGNTLNCDKAYEWWNYLKGGLDEGNTHQLAGDFNHYADFFAAVRQAGHHATADELHNTMEAMVGVEYGMQTGIWWGTAERTRGQFMKATYQGNPGERLGYAEHRTNWTSASVYRHADGKVQAFLGGSERQGAKTNYEFISRDRDVYYNGQGPMRHFVMELPGGKPGAYQSEDNKNAETVLDIQSGADVQPYINGTYRIVNKYGNNSTRAKYLGFSKNPGTGWVQLQQNYKPTSTSNEGYTQWVVEPVNPRIGGDFSYYDFRVAGNENLRMDILNWSLDNGGQVGSYPGGLGNNEQWYLQYAGDGWFYIRSRHSNLALSCNSTSVGAGAVTQTTYKEGDAKQLWRFIDQKAEYDKEAPGAPSNLSATPLPSGILLTWDKVDAEDLMGYDILRTEKNRNDWNLIGRGDTLTCFVDNTAEDGKVYEYAIRATDKALNYSEMSSGVEASSTGEKSLICQLNFEDDLLDGTGNGNHAIMFAEPKYNDTKTNVKRGEYSITFSDDAFLQLPSTISHHDNMTICCWVRRTSTTGTWERIFDFGNGTEQYMFLTPSNGTKMRLELRNNGVTEGLEVSAFKTGMKHIAVTIDGDNGTAKIYVDGELKGTKENLTIKPSDIKGVCNYVGRSQFATDPAFKGNIDDFRIYNYALSAEEIASIVAEEDGIQEVKSDEQYEESRIQAYDLNGRPATRNTKVKVTSKKKALGR